MSVTRTNLNVYQGDDEAWEVTVTLEDNQTPADITGYTAQAQIRRAPADSDPIIITSFNTSVQSPIVFLALTHDQTKDLTGQYVWDLQLTSPLGAITTILRGNIMVTAEVTRIGIPLSLVAAV